MPRKPLTEEEKAVVRGRACRAARKIIIEEGVGAATIRRVAQDIEMSAMSLYTYFANKADLMSYLQEATLSEIADEQERVAWAVKSNEEALRKLELAFSNFAKERPHDFTLAFQGPDKGAHRSEILIQFDRMLAPALERMEAAGMGQAEAKNIWCGWFGRAALHTSGLCKEEETALPAAVIA